VIFFEDIEGVILNVTPKDAGEMIMIGVALKRASILVACRAAPLPIRACFYLLSVKKMKINQSTIWKLGPATFSDLYSAII
jgi:hypothetical protein